MKYTSRLRVTGTIALITVQVNVMDFYFLKMERIVSLKKND